MNKSSSIANQASIIGLTGLVGIPIGFVLQLLVAYYFGAGSDTDAYFMATSTSELLTKLLMGGSVTAVFLPMFVSYLARDQKQQAWYLAMNILHVFTGLFALLLLVVAFFATPFVAFIAPGFDVPTQALTVSILRLVLPSFLFLFAVDVIVAILHSLQQFTMAAVIRLLSPAVSVIAVLALHRVMGIYSLAVGVLCGSLIQLVLVISGLYQQGFVYRFVFSPRHPALGRLLHLLYPFIFSMVFTQGAGITYRILVSELSPGSLSALKYAEKITQLLTFIFISSITTVVYPRLAMYLGKKDYQAVTQTLGYALRLTLLLCVPLTIGAMMLSTPLIRFIYAHGSFTPQAVELTSSAFFFLSLNLSTNAISSILGHAVLAMQRTRAAVAVTIVSQAVAIGLFVVLVPRLQHAGLALGSALVPLASAVLYFIHVRPLLPNADRIIWQLPLLKIGVLGAGLTVLLWIWQQALLRVPTFGNSPVAVIVSSTILGATVFFGGAWAWRMPEMDDVLRLVTARLRKKGL